MSNCTGRTCAADNRGDQRDSTRQTLWRWVLTNCSPLLTLAKPISSFRLKMSSMKRKYSNNPDVFCYIYGSFTPTAQRQSINDFVWRAYFADFKIVLRDQDKALVPNKVCTSCVETLRSWSHGKDKHLPFGISKIWREQVDHVADRYLWMANVKGFNKKNKHLQGVSQLLKQSDWAQIQDFKWYHNDDYIYWKVKR